MSLCNANFWHTIFLFCIFNITKVWATVSIWENPAVVAFEDFQCPFTVKVSRHRKYWISLIYLNDIVENRKDGLRISIEEYW